MTDTGGGNLQIDFTNLFFEEGNAFNRPQGDTVCFGGQTEYKQSFCLLKKNKCLERLKTKSITKTIEYYRNVTVI